MKRKNIYKTALAFSILVLLVITQFAWSQNTEWQERPILLGTSGGNINDISILYCCSGTLGSLVQANNVQYILSNNHVLAKTNKGTIGEDIIQPGLIDQNPACYNDYTDVVANLSKFVPISFKRGTINKVDAAIAQIRSGAVDPSGSIIGIGQVSNSIVPPTLDMAVKKSGRTTGLTHGTITAVNVTVDVTYNKTCGIGSQKARFFGQIMIGPAGFSTGGDSGSLIVEDCSPYSRAVGLLFAGSSTVTVANPISDVLSSLDISMVGANEYCLLGTTSGGITGSSAMTAQSQLPPQANHRAIEAVSKVKERHEEAILRIEGVAGMGIGLSETVPGQVIIEVYVKRPVDEMSHVIPEVLEGIPVKIIETGEIIAY
ncbi:MAG: hypothetical protein HY752_01005 [Nitrospirae bacterium]|nr:hypothetical protein [Nitrospirota bacterium]